MHLCRWISLFLFAGALLALCACSTSRSLSAERGAAGPQSGLKSGEGRQVELPSGLNLPSPRELLERPAPPQSGPLPQPGRGVSEFSRLAFAYEFNLPNSNISASGVNLLMEPQYTPGGPLGGAAYCLYAFFYEEGEFDLSDIALRLEAEALIQQGEPSDFHVLYANYVSNRWDAFSFSALPGKAGPVDTADYVPPQDAEFFYLAILATGSDTWEIGHVRAGNDPPIFNLNYFPAAGQAPLEVSFFIDLPDIGNEVYDRIEWDFDGDGTFELTTEPDVLEQMHIYEAPGSFQTAVRIFDDEDLPWTEIAPVSVSNNIIRTWGGAGDERAFGLALDGQGNVYVCGRNSSSALLLKFDELLELQWAKSWKPAAASAFSEYRAIVCVGPDVFVTGFTTNGDGPPNDKDIILHKYGSDGTLLVQKAFGHGTEDDEGWGLATDGSSLYLTGYIWDSTDDNAHVLAAKLNPDCTLAWGKHDGLLAAAPFYNAGIAVAAWPAENQVAFIAGREGQFDYSPACVLSLDPDSGSVVWQNYYSDSENAGTQIRGRALVVDTNPASLVLFGNSDDGFNSGAFGTALDSLDGSVLGTQFIDSPSDISNGAAALEPSETKGTFIFGGGVSADAYVYYDMPPAGDVAFDQMNGGGIGSFDSLVLDVAAPGNNVYFVCGYAFFADETTWDRHTESLHETPLSLTAANPGFNLEDWSANAADTAIAAADIVGTLDSGGGFQDLMVSKLAPGL